MKTIKRVIVLLVCFVLLSNCFIFSAVGHIDIQSVFPDLYMNYIDPYSISLMDVNYYSWIASGQFYITDQMLNSDDFLYYEDLPYSTDTVVLGLYFGTAASIFLFVNGADTTKPTVQQNYTSSGNCYISIASLSPIYRIGYNHNTGQTIIFNGVEGLTSTNNTTTDIGGVKYYGYSYSMSNDVYMTVSKNASLAYFEMLVNGVVGSAEYGVDSYPTKSDVELQLQKEQNSTSKGIWETLKSLPSAISEFFTNLGDRISSFFNSLGDRIGDFFITLKNYLLYFSDTEPAYDNPFSGLLTSLENFYYENIDSFSNFKGSLDTTFTNISSYLSTGSSILDRIFNGVPLLNVVLIFFLAFAVIRKVVGR